MQLPKQMKCQREGGLRINELGNGVPELEVRDGKGVPMWNEPAGP